jgi:phosphatidylserine/phosphatidylglycerophosphate/cardiolipin synthase-like enzyme
VTEPVAGAHDPATRWFLTADERGNPATHIDRRRGSDLAWTDGNRVEALIDGAAYYQRLFEVLRSLGPGDKLFFTDWRGDWDERLDGEGTEIGEVLASLARGGVDVRGLMWRSHPTRMHFSEQQNLELGRMVNAAGGEVLLDERVRVAGSHHQKLVVAERRGAEDVAFVGGIDLCHGRRDDQRHLGDPQGISIGSRYGARPPWHDVQLAITGPAVGDVETVFRERWEDPHALTRNPVHRVADLVRHDAEQNLPLPAQLPDPAPAGRHSVQLLRTYGQRLGGYPFAPKGERSVARGYAKALRRARRLIYLEDQYLWSAQVASHIADALHACPDLRMIAVLPHYPDQDGRALPPNLIARNAALEPILAAAPGRVAVYGIENHAGTPVYVHAKVCVLDDTWAAVGSDNFNRRSWTHDSELTAAVWDEDATARGTPDSFAVALRSTLAREHLDLASDDPTDVSNPQVLFEAFAASAAALQRWHDSGRAGPRPPGRLRPLVHAPLPWRTRLWAAPMCRLVYDPDGRRPALRWRGRF